MSIIPGISFSRPRWKLIRTENQPMDRNVYLENDHLVDYRVEERTTGQYISGLSLNAYLSLNPTGSALTSSFYGGPTSSFVGVTTSASFVTMSEVVTVVEGVSQSFRQWIKTEFSQSLSTSFSGSNEGEVYLGTPLTEVPQSHGQYIGTIPGADITTVLSSSFETVYGATYSSSIATGSESSSISSGSGASPSGSFVTSSFVTMSVSGSTGSYPASVEVPLAGTEDRAFRIYEIVKSGSFLQTSVAMTLRSVRFI